MTNCIQFINLDDNYIVSVTYESGEDIMEISKFESQRLLSLEDRKIKIKSELRTWDSVRGISVSITKLTDGSTNEIKSENKI